MNQIDEKLNFFLKHSAGKLIIITGFYIFICSSFWSSNLQLSHDNFTYHFWSFLYFASYFSNETKFPNIIYDFGGSEIAMTYISMGYLSPHRILGYFFYWIFPVSPIYGHKISILLGTILNGLGWFFIWQKIFHKSLTPYFCLTVFFLSGIGLTVWHQEQILFTLAYVPWILLCFILGGKYKILSASLLGAALCLHYPQIHILFFSFILLFYFTFGKSIEAKNSQNFLFVSALFFVISVLPLFYIYNIQGNYYSPVREIGGLAASNLDEYLKLNSLQNSSAPFIYLKNLLLPTSGKTDDSFIFSCSIWIILFAILSLYKINDHSDKKFFLIVIGIFLLTCALGTNLFLPQMLFLLKFPFISAFRQWYHFSPLFIVTLITFSGFGFKYLEENISKKAITILSIFIGITCYMQFGTIKTAYLGTWAESKVSQIMRLNSKMLSKKIMENNFQIPPKLPGVKPLVALKSSIKKQIISNKKLIFSEPYDRYLAENVTVAANYIKINKKESAKKNYLKINSELFDLKKTGYVKEDRQKGCLLESEKKYYFRGNLFYNLVFIQKISILIAYFICRRK